MRIKAPLELYEDVVIPEWVDDNAQISATRYMILFDLATDKFYDFVGLNNEYRSTNKASTFTAEIHLTRYPGLKAGDKIRIKAQLLGFDNKRIHYFLNMCRDADDFLAGTLEVISLHIDTTRRRVDIMPDHLVSQLNRINEVHQTLPIPKEAGHVIDINKTL